MGTFLRLLVVFAVIGLFVWLVPPSTPKARLNAEKAEARWKTGMVICPTWPPCWRDGQPIVGAGP
jgi:hypothetical protein